VRTVRWPRQSTFIDPFDSVVVPLYRQAKRHLSVTSIVSPAHYAVSPHIALLGHLADWYQWRRRPATRATRRYDPHRKAPSTFQSGLFRRSNHYLSLCSNHPFITLLPSGIPFAEPPVDDLRFSPPKPKLSLSPLRSFDASNYGKPCLQPVSLRRRSLVPLRTHSPFHSNGQRRLRRTASHSTYSDPPVFTSTHLCPSCSGFMGADYCVRVVVADVSAFL
jgi:hypothetical protein